MSAWRDWFGSLGLISWLLCSSAVVWPTTFPQLFAAQAQAVDGQPTMEQLLMALTDGTYQFCTEPDPQDWRDGAGACFNFVKQELTLEGYYGYPHSGDFICLRGQVSGDWLSGEGLVTSWAGQGWIEIPPEEFVWDREGRLSLNQGEVIESEGPISQIVFGQARLHLQGLYQYPESRMTSPTQLCDWSFNEPQS